MTTQELAEKLHAGECFRNRGVAVPHHKLPECREQIARFEKEVSTYAASEVARERERAVQFLRAGILAMTGRARIKWADGVRDYLMELEREVKS